MIPAVLHFVWVGPRAVPDEWLDAWKELHPGWQVRLWREADLDTLEMVNRAHYDHAIAERSWHGASDLARVEILRNYGGVYVDIDSRPLRTFDRAPFMASDFFAAYEPTPSLPGRLANGTIGSIAGHPILDTYARLVSEMPSLAEPWDTSGGTGLTAAVLVHRQCCKPLVLPARTFYSTDARGRPVTGSEPSYSEHFWATTNFLYPVKAAILVPRRAGDPRRDAAWEFTRQHWAGLGLPIVEGHHEDGPFNAAAARNEAARLAGDWEVGIFVDADTIMLDHASVRSAVSLAAKTGTLVRPYDRYWMLEESSSDELMLTGARPKRRGRSRMLRSGTHGGVNVVPRRLWDAVGGYDERFRGWGWEDTAFEMACRALGGFKMLRGEVFHLWHPIGTDRSADNPQYQANVALGHRYQRAAARRSSMLAMLAERDGRSPDAPVVGAVVITDGRRECIVKTVPSIEAMVGPFAERVICDDSGDPDYAGWLAQTFPGWRVMSHPRLGHGAAVRFAMSAAAAMEVDWVFWSEDDIVYERRIDVGKMVAVMEAEADLKQMVIKRQAWFPSEIEAGGMIERFDPVLFTEHSDNGSSWIEHRQFFSLNPHLISRDILAAIRWPDVPNSEHHFSRRLFRNPRAKVGLWGSKSDDPWVTHVGLERIGIGY